MRKIDLIKSLPEEFDFKTRYGIGNITYHAHKRERDYVVTWDGGLKTYSITEFRRMIFDDEFVPILPGKEKED